MDWMAFNLTATVFTTLISLYLKGKGKNLAAVVFLFLAALFLRLLVIDIDPFLHPWDERFHALVAKNMMDHPLVPTLIEDPIAPYNYKFWAHTHIWIHKQPLFLWQMALSMKAFGVSVFAARLPSSVLGAMMVLLIYRIGKMLKNANTGYFAALFWTFSFYALILTMGLQTNDHNDIAFVFYVTASVWAFSEYIKKPGWKWAVFTGILAGCAVLVKWLTGILVFAGWGVVLLLNHEWRKKPITYVHLTASLITTIAVFLPWQVYIFSKFPKIARFESNLQTKHLYEAVEGHSGSWHYYFGNLDMYFGDWVWLLLVFGLAGVLKLNCNKKLLQALIVYILVTFAFFSIVPTKLPSYVFVAVPFLLIIMAAGLEFVRHLLSSRFPYKHRRNSLLLIVAFLISLHGLQVNHLYQYQNQGQTVSKYVFRDRGRLIHNQAIYAKLDSVTKPGTIIFGGPRLTHINALFHTNRKVMKGIPDRKVLSKLKANNRPLAAFANAPDSITNDPQVKRLPFKLQ